MYKIGQKVRIKSAEAILNLCDDTNHYGNTERDSGLYYNSSMTTIDRNLIYTIRELRMSGGIDAMTMEKKDWVWAIDWVRPLDNTKFLNNFK